MIQLSNLSKSFGERVLLDAVTWQIDDGERVGLCGPNGAGKTTLLRMMAGLEEPDSGAIVKPATLTVGYLPQDGLSHSGRTVFEEASSAFAELMAMKAEMHALEERLGDPSIPESDHDAMLARYSDLQDGFRLHDGYNIELRTATILQGLGFSAADFERRTETFSGGWQMRLALAKLLLGRPNLLLLDEPTNHLDLEARNWLESYLNEYPHAAILVSHDRFFLDLVVTRIADLTLRTLTDYHTNYSGYLIEHHERIEALRKAKREQDEEVARIKMFIDRFRYQATKASQVQSRIKLLEKVVPIDVPPERAHIHFTFPACAKSGRMVLELTHMRKAYDDLVVFDDLTLHIERGDRIALVGPNGTGKSTLMRMLSGEEAPDRGRRAEGHNVVMQYFAQDEATRLDPVPTVYETLASGSPLHMVPAIRHILGGFLFSGDDVYKRFAFCREANVPASPSHACCCVRQIRCCSMSRRTTSIWTRKKFCSYALHCIWRNAHLRVPRLILRRKTGVRRSSRSATERQSSIRARTPSSSGTKKIRRAKARQDWKDRRHATKGQRPVRDASSGHPSGQSRVLLKRPGQQARRPLYLRHVGAQTCGRRGSAPLANPTRAALANRSAGSADRRDRAGDSRNRTDDGGTGILTRTEPRHSRSSIDIRRSCGGSAT